MPALRRAFSNPYDRAHRRRRTVLVRAAIGTICPGDTVNGMHYRSARCTGLMLDPARMDLAHRIPVALGGTRGDTVCCSACNRGAGAILGNQLRAPRPPQPRRQTRVW